MRITSTRSKLSIFVVLSRTANPNGFAARVKAMDYLEIEISIGQQSDVHKKHES